MGDILSKEIMDDWKRLQDKIRENINREEIRRIIRERYGADVDDDDIDVRQGKAISRQDQQALELDLHVSLSLSVLIDEHGNYAISEKEEEEKEMTPEERIEETGLDALESAFDFESQ
ncbi:MAG: hypothetical protein GY849_23285 [Deltaproteobacteria bacterium]|nr:hypothetical protein [Deltaproteobacteria bacterium]